MSAVFLTLLFAVKIYTVYSVRISTKLGDIEGITNNDSVHSFFALPYAQPPIGDLRWKAPQPIKEKHFSDECYDATKWGNACNQPSIAMAMSNDTGPQFIEDCLYLNVFTPYNFEDESNEKLLPVMLWIHGGGLTLGTAMTETYHPIGLVNDQNIVVVTINYRLGAAAWFVDENGDGGANGFMDMIESLKWVQNNIESFGGDPDQVTLAGESGGGVAVCALVLSPLAKGLFRRSIQMSGSCIKSTGNIRSSHTGSKMAKELRDYVNATRINEMRSMDMQTIIDSPPMTWYTSPSIDGNVFPVSPLELLESGHINGESTMIGTVFRESFSAEPTHAGYETANETDFENWLTKHFHDSQVKEIKKYYNFNDRQKYWTFNESIFDNDRESLLIQTTLQTDCWVRCGSIAQTKIISTNAIIKDRVDVYFYQFGYPTEPYDQVSHGFDIAPLFGNGFSSPFSAHIWNDELQEFSKVVMKFFGDYIKGVGPMVDEDENKDIEASVQNGYYLQVIGDNVKRLDIADLDIVKERCKLFDSGTLGDAVFENNAFCLGLDRGDDFDEGSFDMEEAIKQWTESQKTAKESHQK